MKTNSKIFSSLVVVVFTAWLMPLGVFIDSSQEKTACGGQRAVHMCSMMSGNIQTEKGPAKIAYSNPNSAEKTAKSSASGGDDFVPVSAFYSHQVRIYFERSQGDLFRPQFFPEIQIPPPRAISSL